MDDGLGRRRATYPVICRVGDRTRVVIVVNVAHGRGAYRSRARVRLAHCRIIFSTSIKAAPLRPAGEAIPQSPDAPTLAPAGGSAARAANAPGHR